MSEEFKKEEINGEAAEKTKAAEHTEEVKAETTAEQSAAETEKPQETAEAPKAEEKKTTTYSWVNPFSKRKSAKQKRNTINLWCKIVVACLPAAVIGLLFDDILDKYLYNYVVVALMLIIYGIFFILIEKKNEHTRPQVTKLTELTYQMALIIGGFQVLALIPGTSRSGATILGALLIGTSRYVATEFTFYLAIPVMFGASILKVIKFGFHYTAIEVVILLVGCLVAFFVSVFAIKFLMGYIKKHDFKAFGYYRIVLGVLVLLYFLIFG